MLLDVCRYARCNASGIRGHWIPCVTKRDSHCCTGKNEPPDARHPAKLSNYITAEVAQRAVIKRKDEEKRERERGTESRKEWRTPRKPWRLRFHAMCFKRGPYSHEYRIENWTSLAPSWFSVDRLARRLEINWRGRKKKERRGGGIETKTVCKRCWQW